MSLSYHDVMTADLSSLSDVSDAWHEMAKRFGELKDDYRKHVQGALGNGGWQGEAHDAHQNIAQATAYEYAAAKKEALAIARLLKQAHTELTRLQKAVKDLVADAEKKHYKVDSSGKATYVGLDTLSEQSQSTVRHDPDYSSAATQARNYEQEWTDEITKAVKAVDTLDRSVKRALSRATRDSSADGSGIGGFNAQAEDDLEKAGAPTPKPTPSEWKVESKRDLTGPDSDFSATGVGYGKEFMVKAYSDVVHGTWEKSGSNGNVTLSAIGDFNVGTRTSMSGGITESGIGFEAEWSAGARALGEGRVESGIGSAYLRGSGFAGAERAASLKLGVDGFEAGYKEFKGAKVGGAVGVEAGGVGSGVTGEVWTGVGVEGDVTFGIKEGGKFHIGAELGASLPVGGKLGGEFTVDPGPVVDTAKDAAGSIGDAAGKVGGAAGSVKNAFTDLF
ncbi:hypothetical protein [Streptomyces cucumeris]|uniref:hypothetical protein n=1 Tax=Streptomyces cucumeris TaxID=2962890 RepID=UPI003D75584F